MITSMAQGTATISVEQSMVTTLSRSPKIQNLDCKVLDGVSQIASHVLKQKSIANFHMPPIIPRGMDELQIHANPSFQPFNVEDNGYSSSDSFLLSSKESLFLQDEVKSSHIVCMSVKVTRVANFKEQLAR